MATRTKYILVSNNPGEPRETHYHWGQWYEQDGVPVKYLDAVKEEFKKGKIKWWLLYKQTFDFTNADLSVEVVDKQVTEEIPPVEFNLAAKGAKLASKPFLKQMPKGVWAQANPLEE